MATHWQRQGVGRAKASAKGKAPSHVRLCAFCLGTDEMNRKTKKPEPLVCCSECGSCGHPSCMHWDHAGKKLAVVRTYDWHCMECKTCEVCLDKGDDEQIMFCDRCDRGWHLYCLRPALDKPPRGLWYCPTCQPPAPPNPAPSRTIVRIKRKPKGEEAPVKKAKATEPLDDEPFSGLLTGDDANTTTNEPSEDDMERYQASKRAAEYQLGGAVSLPSRTLHAPSHNIKAESVSAAGASTGKARPISMIRFGSYDIQTWFQAPFPEEYSVVPDGRLWMCEFCLKYMKSRFMATRHRMKCMMHYPPGQEIYRANSISVFEVDGSKNKIYCQNLCLLAKLFLDHKTLYYDVEPFLFYVFVESDASGSHFVGYYSKEKRSPMDYNVSCIMTLPIHQRRGWGYFLIEMSYLLSQKEGRLGSPEKPLSDLGFLTYRSYWKLAVFRALQSDPTCTLDDLCIRTGMKMDDVLYTLQDNHMIEVFHNGTDMGRLPPQYFTEKSGKDQRRESPAIPLQETPIPNDYRLVPDLDGIRAHLANHDAKKYVRVDRDKLRWTPFLFAPPPPIATKPDDEAL
ncbi:histone acetyltransferase 3 [Malassezia pachydermatis]|uniref:Histone acetyltransferase n=1 Tax=Malassezia pachydermatis TaxID=77020 RepID=A0A0M8MMV4_9BASI|nr:histone acetyltransferase 3 [Malassezia pachydermatis]KOS14758.1 histone acetyltransferase 3 [Malassezia pachydermatis]